MSSRLSKIRSLHTYVMLRTVYFGWICMIPYFLDEYVSLNCMTIFYRNCVIVRRLLRSLVLWVPSFSSTNENLFSLIVRWSSNRVTVKKNTRKLSRIYFYRIWNSRPFSAGKKRAGFEVKIVLLKVVLNFALISKFWKAILSAKMSANLRSRSVILSALAFSALQ